MRLRRASYLRMCFGVLVYVELGNLMTDFENGRISLGQVLANCETAGSASDEMIKAAENELGVRFPFSYRQFLREFGAAICQGFWIAGLTAPIGDEPPFWPDVVISTKQLRSSDGHLSRFYVSISDDGADLNFFIDTEVAIDGQESPVVALGPGIDGTRVATSFAEFVILHSQDRLSL